MVKNKNIETLSEDMLSDHIIRIFKPIFFIQSLFGFLRVNIRHRFITAPSHGYRIYSIFVWAVFIICIGEYIVNCDAAFNISATEISLKFCIMINGCANAIIAWRNNFLYGNSNSQLYVKLQKIERDLDMNDAYLDKKLVCFSIASSTSIALLVALWIAVFNIFFVKTLCPSSTVAILSNTGNYLEINLAILIMYFIIVRVDYINKMLGQNTMSIKHEDTQVNNQLYVIKVDEITEEIVPNELVAGMHSIIEAFAAFMDLFQYSIFSFTCQMMTWNLTTMNSFVSIIKEQMPLNMYLILRTAPALLSMIAIMLVLCYAAETLASKLEESRKLCISIMSTRTEGNTRRNAKQIAVMVECKRSVSIYNIFTLGSRLPLHLFAITTTYAIVLLQFALL